MLKAAIEKIEAMVAPKTYEINGKTWASEPLNLVEEAKKKPGCIQVNGLDSICKLIENEIIEVESLGGKVYIQAESHRKVEVFTTYDDDFGRTRLYTCTADVPSVTTDYYMDYEKAVIELRSLYIPNEGSEYLLNLIGSISKESNVTTNDNGITQQVEAKSGVALREQVTVKPRVSLQPFRTFLEIAQPESEFLLRINQNGQVGLFPADGGVWKLEAKRNIVAYFEKRMKDLIDSGKVVVIM